VNTFAASIVYSPVVFRDDQRHVVVLDGVRYVVLGSDGPRVALWDLSKFDPAARADIEKRLDVWEEASQQRVQDKKQLYVFHNAFSASEFNYYRDRYARAAGDRMISRPFDARLLAVMHPDLADVFKSYWPAEDETPAVVFGTAERLVYAPVPEKPS